MPHIPLGTLLPLLQIKVYHNPLFNSTIYAIFSFSPTTIFIYTKENRLPNANAQDRQNPLPLGVCLRFNIRTIQHLMLTNEDSFLHGEMTNFDFTVDNIHYSGTHADMLHIVPMKRASIRKALSCLSMDKRLNYPVNPFSFVNGISLDSEH